MKNKYFYNKEIRDKLNFIIQKGYCNRTFFRAKKAFYEIKDLLDENDVKIITKDMLKIDPDYPDNFGPTGAGKYDWYIFSERLKEMIDRTEKENEINRCR